MNEASLAQMGKNAALLSPCHNQSSRLHAEFCGSGTGAFAMQAFSVNCYR
jgi:hypothetical protein